MGGFFVLRAEKVEDRGFFVLRRKKSHPSLSCSVRSSTHSSGPKMEDGWFFDLRLRRSRIEDGGGSSIFGSEDRRWGVFDLRLRRTKKEGAVVRRTPLLRRTPPPYFFVLRVRRSKNRPQLRSSEPKIGSKIAVGPVVPYSEIAQSTSVLGDSIVFSA